MANLLRKMVKNVQDITLISNIPEMKLLRDSIKEDIKLNEAEIEKYNTIKQMNLDNLITSLTVLNQLTPPFFPTELQNSSKNICEFLQNTNDKQHIDQLLQTREELNDKLIKIKEKIDKARKITA